MLALCDVFVSAVSNLESSKLVQTILPQHASLVWQRNTEQFRKFAVRLVQLYQELQDLADPKSRTSYKLDGK